jgi:transcriptional regulator with XRE-family HTH domain
MSASSPLADFLRTRRDAVRPKDVGIDDGGERRVPGLRREELALLAGVSVDYYTRLEQGRNRHPSPQVLSALAGPLGLDETEIRYAWQLAQPPLPPRNLGRPENVRPGMLRMVDGFDRNPALILGRYRDVLAANALASALNPGFVVGSNILRYVFLDPESHGIYRNWDEVAREAARTLRVAIGADDVDDPRFTCLIEELTQGSEHFRLLWERHELRRKTIGRKHFNNPFVGLISLDYESLTINGGDGQTLSVYHAEPGSPDEQALELLAATAAKHQHRSPTA